MDGLEHASTACRMLACMIDDGLADHLLATLPQQPFTAAAAQRGGVPRKLLGELVASGRLRRPFRGVLIPAACDDSLTVRAEAVRLVLPEGASLCRVTAAWLLGIDARPLGTHLTPPPLQCAVPLGKTPLRRPGLQCFITDLIDDDVIEIAGLPCVTPARTAVDLARWSMPGMGLAVLDAMARAALIAPAELAILVERWRGDRFVGQARRLIGLCDPRAESFGESWLRLRFHDAGFPPPELQISLVDDAGIEVRRLDLGYPRWRHAWEYDGEEHHLGLAAEAADRRRRAEIDHRWGWTVVGLGKNLVLGPSMALEYGVGDVIGMQPALRRRLW